jgi:hypothetical protein
MDTTTLFACLALCRKRRARNKHRLEVARMLLRSMELALKWHRIRTRHFLRQKDLVPIHASPWSHLKAISEDHSALQVMGITWAAFDHLMGFFGPVLEQLWCSRHSCRNPRGSGRKLLMGTEDVLGLTLAWIHVPAYHLMLMLTWALTPGTLSLYLRDGRRTSYLAGPLQPPHLLPCTVHQCCLLSSKARAYELQWINHCVRVALLASIPFYCAASRCLACQIPPKTLLLRPSTCNLSPSTRNPRTPPLPELFEFRLLHSICHPLTAGP